MAALVISSLIYVGIVLGYILVSRHIAVTGDATGSPSNPLFLGEGAEPAHKADFHTRRLTEEEWAGFVGVWRSVRARFDQDPRVAIVYADLLISDLVANNSESGQRAGDCNFKYRTAHELMKSERTGVVNTEELRRAMSLYATLFEELVVRTGRNPPG